MVTSKKVTGTAWSMPAGLAWGAGISSIITLGGALLAAYLISNGTIGQNYIGYCSMVILLLASFLGARGAAKRIKHRTLFVSAISAIIYYGLLLSCTAMLFGGSYQGMGATGLMVLCGMGLAILREVKGEGRRRKKKNKIRHR